MLRVKWCCNHIKTPHKNIMPEFRNACLQEYAKDALFESFPSLQNPILRNIQITHISKTVQKVVPNIFEINLKIN